MRYVLIYCTSGKVSMQVDDKEFIIHAGEVITITSGQIHCISKATKAKLRILSFMKFFHYLAFSLFS